MELAALRYTVRSYCSARPEVMEMIKLPHNLKRHLFAGISLLMSLHAHASTTMNNDRQIPTTLATQPWSVDLPSERPQWTEAEAEQLRVRGQAVLQQIRDASRAGQPQVVLAPGDYLFNADWSKQSTLAGLADLEILAEGVTFWFEPPLIDALRFEDCRNVTVRGLTIDYTQPGWFQARVTEVDHEANTIRASVMPGYQPINAQGEPERSGERAFMFYQADGSFINHRHTPTQWELVEDGVSLVCRPGRFGIPTALQAGDYVVGSLRGGVALRTMNCANMRYESLNIWSSSGIAVYEGGGEGGHVYRNIRATRRPDTNRLHAFGADVFHLAGADRGPTLDGCEMAYGSDDSLNIHGNFGRVVAAEDATHVYLQGAYNAGDRLEFRDPASLELLGFANVLEAQATPDGPSLPINETYSAKGEYLVTLDQPLELPALSMVVMDGKQSAAGFVVRNCWMHDTFQRILINGSPGGLIENNLFENLGYGLCIQFETWGPWMEGPFARDLVVRGNRFQACAPEEVVIAVTMFPAGGATQWDAMPVTNMTIEDNVIDAASGFPVKIRNVDGLKIRGNQIQLSPLSEIIPRADWRALKDPSCIWSQGSVGTPRRWLDLQDCANVTVQKNELIH